MKSNKIKLILLVLLESIAIFSLVIIVFLRYVSQKTGRPLLYFPVLFFNNQPADISKNILILGLDPRDDQLEKTETTDTILIVNIKSDRVNLIPLPRDLYDLDLRQKINQYYPESKNQTDQLDYVQKNIFRITGIKIDKTVVIKTKNLADIVDIIGGVDVYLDQELTDKQYPNPEYIANPDSDYPIYITINYPSGKNHLNGERIIPFVRSRKSSDSESGGGTDLGRIKRQQLVINAIFNKLKNNEHLSSLDIYFNLYNYWKSNVETNLKDSEVMSIIKYLLPNLSKLSIITVSLPVSQNNNPGVIYHPNYFLSSQWVFLPIQNDYQNLKNYLNQKLNNQ